ncbi:MAG: hypothetical protein Hyperionvirus1_63 [Hyperionvirus sp.]|uniref:Uncharacterized protein n=1 Tax=Hyperionvirus sp. TaxID=2487770 RepID=A0A3G5A7J7_9VIRU|nr:MAG: hypothetical protein Hyperionvirus1_63 [Hyperionvirus sp.]
MSAVMEYNSHYAEFEKLEKQICVLEDEDLSGYKGELTNKLIEKLERISDFIRLLHVDMDKWELRLTSPRQYYVLCPIMVIGGICGIIKRGCDDRLLITLGFGMLFYVFLNFVMDNYCPSPKLWIVGIVALYVKFADHKLFHPAESWPIYLLIIGGIMGVELIYNRVLLCQIYSLRSILTRMKLAEAVVGSIGYLNSNKFDSYKIILRDGPLIYAEIVGINGKSNFQKTFFVLDSLECGLRKR